MRRVPSRFAGQGTIRIDMQKIDVEIFTDKIELEKIQPEWQSCFDRSDAPPYLCYEWFRLYQEHFGDSTTLRVVVARIDGQVCAVLPLENLSGDPTKDYLADGMTEALITHLAKRARLRVISRTSVMRYKNAPKSLPEIAAELNVQRIVEGCERIISFGRAEPLV